MAQIRLIPYPISMQAPGLLSYYSGQGWCGDHSSACPPAAESRYPSPRRRMKPCFYTQGQYEAIVEPDEVFSFAERSTPTLWHTEIHVGDMFVSQEDHTRIVGPIDCQPTSISSLFL